MKKNNTISENISAYIDGELSPNDVLSTEAKIKTSFEIKKKYDEFIRLKKLTSDSFKPLDESPYFETRLTSALNDQKSFSTKLKHWSPALLIGSITIFLMILLKFNPNLIENLFEQQKSKIAGFYKENLRPLLFAADLNNDDIFNFALYSQLPLDKSQERYLQFGYDNNGNGIFEIKTINDNQKSLDLQKFKIALELNQEESQQIDSIINAYAAAIEPLILVNDKNTVAVNPGVWNYQKAMLADILSFAENSNKQKFRGLVPAGFSFAGNDEVAGLVAEVKNLHDNNYIFFTPDSIFSEKFQFDQEEFNKDIGDLQKDLERKQKDAKLIQSLTFRFDSSMQNYYQNGKFDSEIKVFIDSNKCRVHIPKIKMPEINLPNFDSLNSLIEDVVENFQNFSFVLPEIPEAPGKHFDFKIEKFDSTGEMNFNIDIPNIDSILEENGFFIDPTDSLSEEKLKSRNKSLEKLFKDFNNDAQKWNSQGGSIKQQFESLKKEMENLRLEMQQWRNKLDQNKSVKEAEIIEI